MAHTVIQTDELIEQGKFDEAIRLQTRRVKWLYENANKNTQVVDEKIVRLIVHKMQKQIEELRIKAAGIVLFDGSEWKFNRWMATPVKALGNVAPATLMENAKGRELVYNELTRIACGILS